LKLPRSVAVTLFENRSYRRLWQPTLLGYEPLSGSPARDGGRWRLRHRAGKREISIIETVTTHAPPHEVTATYEMPGAWSRVENRFEEIGPSETRWSVESEFRCTGLMKVTAVLLPSLFKRQTMQSMQRFKEFAEKEFAEERLKGGAR
jgi:hypothetical protein